MRKVLLLLMAVVLMSASEPVSLTQAKQEASREGKLILLRFTGSDWCGPCKAMDRRVFQNDSFRHFSAQHLVLLEADFPQHVVQDEETRKQNKLLARKYQKSQSYPYMVLLDAEGNALKTWRGYGGQYPRYYIDEIVSFLPDIPLPSIDTMQEMATPDTIATGIAGE